MSFSFWPSLWAPGSWPPWPASMTTTLRACIAGCDGRSRSASTGARVRLARAQRGRAQVGLWATRTSGSRTSLAVRRGSAGDSDDVDAFLCRWRRFWRRLERNHPRRRRAGIRATSSAPAAWRSPRPSLGARLVSAGKVDDIAIHRGVGARWDQERPHDLDFAQQIERQARSAFSGVEPPGLDEAVALALQRDAGVRPTKHEIDLTARWSPHAGRKPGWGCRPPRGWSPRRNPPARRSPPRRPGPGPARRAPASPRGRARFASGSGTWPAARR